MKCKVCGQTAAVAMKSHNAGFCEKCFLDFFRKMVARGIKSQNLFAPSTPILVAMSGGKDSLSLALELKEQGYVVHGLFIDLAIPESSAVARETTETFCRKHGIELLTRDLAREGLSIPLVKKALRRPVCSACGKIKRYYFNKIALEEGFTLATGHNLDDEVARLFSNALRWDEAYLSAQGPLMPETEGFARKTKPLWRLTEFETANYAFLRGVECHSAPCPYAKGASFSVLKNIMQNLENVMPGRKIDFYHGYLERGKPAFALARERENRNVSRCENCGAVTSGGKLCGVCGIRIAIAQA